MVTGDATPAAAGHGLRLLFARAGSENWQALRSTTAGGGGRFRFVARLRRSGLVKVAPAAATAIAPAAALSSTGAASTPDVSASVSERVSVAARLDLPARTLNVLAGQAVHIRGRLLPGHAGRKVRLQALTRRGWRTLATTRSRGRGGFDLRYAAAGTGRERLRVRFAGDRLNAWTGARAGALIVYHADLASWYDDGGSTACGFHAYYGVANRTLPCGTRVTFRAGGRTVTATVDDRGPYVYPRTWDLNQNTAAALGFGGVGVVWSTL